MAGAKVRGITIDLGVDASGVTSGLKSVNSAISSTGKELKDIDRLLKLDPTNVTLLAQKHEALQRQIANTRDKLNLLKEAEERLKEQMVDGGTDEQKRQLEALQREIIATEHDLEKYEKQLDSTEDETKDLARAEQQAEQATEGMKQGFTVLKGALANLVADGIRKAVEGFKDLMTAGPAFGDEIMSLASKTGLATDTLQELSYMSGLVDVDVSTVAGSLKKLTKNMDSARGGTGSAAEAFKTLGVSVTDINGNLRDSEDVFFEAIDALGKIENETERDAVAMNLFGKSATDLNPMIEAGSDALRGFAEEAHEMGYVLDKDALEALGRVQDEFDRFKGLMDSVKNQIAAGVAPAIERGMKKIQDVIKKIDWKKVGQQMGNAFNALIDAFEWIIDNGNLIKSLLTGIITAMAVNKVLSFVSAVGSMATALKTATTAQQGLNAAANANPYVLLASAVIAVTTAMVSFGKGLNEATYEASLHVQAANSLIEASDEIIASITAQTEAYEENRKAREQTMSAGIAETDYVQGLSNELKTLADASGTVNEKDKARAQYILGELNKALGTEYEMTGNQIQGYTDLATSIDNVLLKKKAEIILSSQEEAMAEAIAGRQQAELDLAAAQQQRLENEAQMEYYNQREIELTEALANSGQYNGAFVTELANIADSKRRLVEENKALDASYQESADLVDKYTWEITQYEDNMTHAIENDYDKIQNKTWETAKAQGVATSDASKAVANNALYANNQWLTNLDQMLDETTGKDVSFQDAGKGMVQAYVDGQKYGQPLTISQLATMNTQMVNKANSVKGSMQAAGREIPSGVASGILSSVGTAYNAVASMAQNLSATFRNNLNIKSPSRVFAEYGGFIVEGVAEGIEDNEGIAIGAVEDFSDNLQNAFNPSIGGNYSTMVSGGGIASVGSAMSSEAGILNLLSKYLPELVNRDVTLDGDTLVGKLAPKYNKQFGRLETLNARGV